MERTSLPLGLWCGRAEGSSQVRTQMAPVAVWDPIALLFPLQRLELEIPLPMPSQHHKSSTAISGFIPGLRLKN